MPSRLSTRSQPLRAPTPWRAATSRPLSAGSNAAPSSTLSCPVSRPPPHLQHQRAVEQAQSRERRTGSAHKVPPPMLRGLRDPRLDHRRVGPEQLRPLRMVRVFPGQQAPARRLEVRLALPAKGVRRRLAHRRPGARAPVRDIVRVLAQPPPGTLRTASLHCRRHPPDSASSAATANIA